MIDAMSVAKRDIMLMIVIAIADEGEAVSRLDSECHEPYDIMLRRLANPTIKILLDLEIPIQVEIKIQVSFTTKKQPFKVQISISKKKEVREEVQVLKEWTEVLKFTF
ncbi:hypothetical protein Cadr_000018047 [Camelus dromedarius]|uniref:Uncharacterized protein n=1 Tax=Camelus dromedarius TaxID=9838 RepID=A0A5N4D6U3_CAMDR|nr:hypothetical protein Cadr_000018047 [Camelus dromedarius]